MKHFHLEQFTRGWVVGDFLPSIVQTQHFEFGLKRYSKGDKETRHFHKRAEEITMVVSGSFKMNGQVLKEGDIVLVEKEEAVDFECLESGYTAVVKIPSVKGDKFLRSSN